MTDLLRSPSMSTIGGFINSAKALFRKGPNNPGTVGHVFILKATNAIHIRSWFMFETIPGIPWQFHGIPSSNVEEHVGARCLQPTTRVLETQHAVRSEGMRSLRNGLKAVNFLSHGSEKRVKRITLKMYVQHGACQRKVAYLNCCKKKTTSNPLRLNLSRTRFNHANCHVCIPQIGKYNGHLC